MPVFRATYRGPNTGANRRWSGVLQGECVCRGSYTLPGNAGRMDADCGDIWSVVSPLPFGVHRSVPGRMEQITAQTATKKGKMRGNIKWSKAWSMYFMVIGFTPVKPAKWVLDSNNLDLRLEAQGAVTITECTANIFLD